MANLKNLLDAISGLLCVIYAQIGDNVQMVFDSNMYFSADDDIDIYVRSFQIIPYVFPENEKYDFNWRELQSDPNCFQIFPFI